MSMDPSISTSQSSNSHPTLPVLQAMVSRMSNSGTPLNLENVLFVCCQHFLHTTVDLFKSITTLGAKPDNIHVLGKIYSTCPAVVHHLTSMGIHCYPSATPNQLGSFIENFMLDLKNMWMGAMRSLDQIDTIIILDDGGKCIASCPPKLIQHYKMVAVEQTSSGIAHLLQVGIPMPVITVACSAAKKLECSMVAKAVKDGLNHSLTTTMSPSSICGVVGFGKVGRAVTELLLSQGHGVLVCDMQFIHDNSLGEAKQNIQQVFQEADYIFGCTGTDITKTVDIKTLHGNKTLVSCSSQDTEFLSFLKLIQIQNLSNAPVSDVLANVEASLGADLSIRIIKGGYPVNFDHTGESIPAEDIQLTRGLLFGALIQATILTTLCEKMDQKIYILHPTIQTLVVNEYGKAKQSSCKKAKSFQHEDWVTKNSGGEFQECGVIRKIFE